MRACGALRGTWGRVVRAYKTDPTAGAAVVAERVLAERMRRFSERHRGRHPGEAVLVAVPMAGVRRRERGFNPAEVLASAVAARLGWPCRPEWLARVRSGRPLRGLPAAQRRTEVAGAFEARVPDPPPESVILVDEVLTTGATLREAAAALRQAGVPEVRAWVLGRTPRRSALLRL